MDFRIKLISIFLFNIVIHLFNNFIYYINIYFLDEFKTYSFQVEYSNFYGVKVTSILNDVQTSSYESVYSKISRTKKYEFYIWETITIESEFSYITCLNNQMVEVEE